MYFKNEIEKDINKKKQTMNDNALQLNQLNSNLIALDKDIDDIRKDE